MGPPAMQRREFIVCTGLAWLVAAAYLLSRDFTGLAQQFGSTDDALRLVMLREFLAGKGWFDLAVLRLDPPHGSELHWSRLIDAGLGLLFRLSAFMVEPARAELLTRALWPVLWLLPVIGAAGSAALKIGGRAAALVAIAYGAVALPGFLQFAPGRIDHHNVQIALAATAVAAVMWSEGSARLSALAGTLCGAMLAIGLESLFFVFLLVAAFALRFVRDPHSIVEFRSFAVALAAATTLAFLLSVAPWRWSATLCDQIAVNTALPVAAGALLAAASSFSRLATVSGVRRALLVIAAGMVAFALFAGIGPDCLRGPFVHVDPAVKHLWLDHVQEALPLIDALRTREQASVAGILAVPLAGCAAAVLLLASRRAKVSFADLLISAALVTSLLASLFAVRWLPFAVWFAIPLVAAALADLWRRPPVADPARRAALVVAFSPLLLSGIAVTASASFRPAIAAAVPAGPGTPCTAKVSYGVLAGLPAGRVMAFIDLGPHVLVHTAHDVVAGPYHRLSRSIIDSYVFSPRPSGRHGKSLGGAGSTTSFSVHGRLHRTLPASSSPMPCGTGSGVRTYRIGSIRFPERWRSLSRFFASRNRAGKCVNRHPHSRSRRSSRRSAGLWCFCSPGSPGSPPASGCCVPIRTCSPTGSAMRTMRCGSSRCASSSRGRAGLTFTSTASSRRKATIPIGRA